MLLLIHTETYSFFNFSTFNKYSMLSIVEAPWSNRSTELYKKLSGFLTVCVCVCERRKSSFWTIQTLLLLYGFNSVGSGTSFHS